MAVDIFRYVRAAGEVDAQKETLQPEPDESEIETKRKRGTYSGRYAAQPLVMAVLGRLW